MSLPSTCLFGSRENLLLEGFRVRRGTPDMCCLKILVNFDSLFGTKPWKKFSVDTHYIFSQKLRENTLHRNKGKIYSKVDYSTVPPPPGWQVLELVGMFLLEESVKNW